jgi:hypothetical protein
LYSSPNIIRQIKSRRIWWARQVAYMGKERKVYKVSAEKTGGKRPLGRLRHRWEDGVKTNLRETGWGVEFIHLARDRD